MKNSIRHTALSIIMLASATMTVQAHAPVRETSITNGAVLETAPAVFTVSFAGKVGLAALTVTTGTGDPVPLEYTAPKSMQDSFDIPLPDLAEGAYTITWRTMSADGHIMTDHISFTVK